MKVAIFLQSEFEEIEGITPIDLLRRAGIEVETISINDSNEVVGSRGVKVFTDKKYNEFKIIDYTMLVLPGGKGTQNYYKNSNLLSKIKQYYEIDEKKEKYFAAICAAPTVFASLNMLRDKRVTCFPECEDELKKKGAILEKENVVQDENIITGKAAGAAIEFSLKLIEVLMGKEKATEISNEIYYCSIK